jgi:CRP-like cAMP-binding protein
MTENPVQGLHVDACDLSKIKAVQRTESAMNTAANPTTAPQQNQLLAALSASEREHWWPHLETVTLKRGQVLCESGVNPDHAYFPITAIVSLVYLTLDGESTETAVVGRDGMVGISLFMGGSATPTEAVVQSAGLAYRLRSQFIRSEASAASPVLKVLLRYTLTMMAQVAQTAACNRFHSIDQLYCRRLLMGLDRSSSDELTLTQEHAASLLGVRREGVTAAANKLQGRGAIRYRRGQICVLDRQQLEASTCDHFAHRQSAASA